MKSEYIFSFNSQQIKKTFTKDLRNHYIFTPKMLSKLIEGLKYYPADYLQQVHNKAQSNQTILIEQLMFLLFHAINVGNSLRSHWNISKSTSFGRA